MNGPGTVFTETIRGLFSKLLNNPDFFGAVLTGYGLVTAQTLVQILLVPLYLETLGRYGFGALSVILAFVGFVVMGTGWLSGAVIRVLARAAVARDWRAFARDYAAAKIAFVGYAFIVALILAASVLLAGDAFFADAAPGRRPDVLLALLVATLYFIALIDLMVDVWALSAVNRRTGANLLMLASVAVFVMAVVPVLWMGGGVAAVVACLFGGTLVARAAAVLYWRRVGIQAGWGRLTADVRASVRRYARRVGEGYAIYALIVMGLQADILLVGVLGGSAMAAEFTLIWKIPEFIVLLFARVCFYLQPHLVAMEAAEEHERLRRVFRQGIPAFAAIAIAAGLAYAAFGPWLVRLWVGAEHAPADRLAFVLAGGAVAWLGATRLPAMFAYALARLRRLNAIAGAELVLRLAVILAAFPAVGYLANLAAVNAAYVLGAAAGYTWVGYRALKSAVPGRGRRCASGL